MCFWIRSLYMELEVDESVVVQRVDYHEVQILLGISFLFWHVVVPLDTVHDEGNQDLKTGIFLHYS